VPLTTLDDRTALVLIDLQAGILGMPTAPLASADVLARAQELADGFRRHGLPVVLVRVSVSPDGADAVPGRTDAPPPGIRAEGWDVLAPELVRDGDILVTKRNWSAFYGTDLDLQLRRRGVTQIVLGGIATSIGVESTARAAHERAYNLALVTDAMSDRDTDAHHNSVTRIFPRLGETTTTAEVLAALEHRPPAVR
jgi:nicotinamidase-related amidase